MRLKGEFGSLERLVEVHEFHGKRLRPFLPVEMAAAELSLDELFLYNYYDLDKIDGFTIQRSLHLYLDSFLKYKKRHNFEEERLYNLIIGTIFKDSFPLYEDKVLEQMKFNLPEKDALKRLYGLLTRLSIRSAKSKDGLLWAMIYERDTEMPSSGFFELARKLELKGYLSEESGPRQTSLKEFARQEWAFCHIHHDTIHPMKIDGE